MTVDRFSPYIAPPLVIENNSGERSAEIPPQAKGGSWGAFMFGGVWALCNGVWFGALSFLAVIAQFIPHDYPTLRLVLSLAGQGVWLYLILRGRSLAWTHKRWASYEEFDKAQRTWSRVAKIVFFGSLVMTVVAVVVIWKMVGQGLSGMS